MNVLLIGYGHMGKHIEAVLNERNHTIVQIIDIQNKNELHNINPSSVDVAIEFTIPGSAYENIKNCLSKGIRVVTGTTGWHDKISEAEQLCMKNNTAFLYASNFSLGVNILFAMNKKLGEIMNQYGQYEASIHEKHHTRKKDKPSGTAVTLATQLINNIERYNSYTLEKADKHHVGITAEREGDVFGDHKIRYESDIDSIEISHSAKNRMGFALGAVMAAEHIHDKTGIFTMKDILHL